jgi:flagellar protein FliL
MHSKMKLIVAFVFVAITGALVAGSAVWWLYLSKPSAPGQSPASAEFEAAPTGKKAHKYITLEKVIVMLRRNPGDTTTHYMSTDIVIPTTEEKEKQTKENLPLLRSIAVKSLAAYSIDKAEAMTVDQFAEQLNRAFEANYVSQRIEKPFSEVMIGKLIIE